jgi:hypothetical protein
VPSLAPTDNAPPPPAQPSPTPAPVPAPDPAPVSAPSPSPTPVPPPSGGDSYGNSAAVSGPSSSGNDGYANSAAVASNPDAVPSPPPDAAQAAQFAQPTISADLPVDNAAVARKFADISANPLNLSPEEHARIYGKQIPPTTPTPGGYDLAESPAAQKPQEITPSSGYDLAESPLSKQQAPQPSGYDLSESPLSKPGASLGYDLAESPLSTPGAPPSTKPPAQLLSEQYGNNHQAIMKAGGDDPTIDPDLVLNAMKYADSQKGIPIPGEVNAATVGGRALKDIAPWLDPTNANTWAMVGGMIKGVPEFIQGTGNQAKETLENLGQIFIPNANRSRMQILSDQLFNHQITLSQYNDTLAQIRSGMSTGEAPPQLPQEQKAIAESADVQARAKAEALPSFELGLRQNAEAVSSIWRNALGFEVNSPIGSGLRWLGQGQGDLDATPEQQIAALSLPGFPIPVVRARDAATMDDHERLIQLQSMRAQTNINKGLQSGYVSPTLDSINSAFVKGNTPEHLNEIGYPVRPEYVESGASMVNQALMVPEFAVGGEVSAATGLDSLANTAGGYLLRAGSQVPKMVGDVASTPFDWTSSLLKGSSNLAAKYPRILGMGAVSGVNTALHFIEPSLSLPFHGEMADYLLSKPIGQFLSPPVSTGLSAMSNWAGAVPKGIRMLTEPFTQGLDLAGKDMIAEGGNLLSSRASWDAITKKPMSAEELANMPLETSKNGTDYDIFGGRKVVYDTKTITPAGQLPETGKSGLLPSPEETPLTKERAIPPPKKGSAPPPEPSTNGQTAAPPPPAIPPETPIVTKSTQPGFQGPITNVIRSVAPGITHGAVSTYPLAYLSSPGDPEAQGKFMALGMALGGAGAPAALGDAVKNTLFDHLFSRDPSVSRPGIDVAPIQYGTRKDLDATSLAEINRIDPTTGQYAYSNAQKQAFHTARFAMNGAAEIHILPSDLYAREMNAMNERGVIQNPDVNSRGVTIDPNPSARAPEMDVSKLNAYGPPENPQGPPELQQSRILIRGTPASLDAALTHEMSHPFVNRMSIADQDNLFNLITRQNDPNVFTHNYTNGVTNYDHLPSEDGVANGTEPYVAQLPYMTKEDMKREMITENLSGLFKGDLLTKYSRNPGLIRGGQMVLGNILERMGIDTTTGLSTSILGVKPSFGASVVLDALTRESMQKNVHLRTPQGVGGSMARPLDAPIDPVQAANDAAVIKGLIKLGYTPELAAAQLAMSKRLTAPSSPNAPKQSSPAEVAKGILVKGRGFTQDEADRHVPADAKTASEAANNATLSILSERKSKGIPSPDEQASESQTVEKPFVPSKDWQKVPDHIMLSNPEGSGMDLKLDAGGGKLARWDNPPGQETILNKRTGKLQDRAKLNGFVHDTPNGEPIETPEIYPDEISPNDLPPNAPPSEPPTKAQHMPEFNTADELAAEHERIKSLAEQEFAKGFPGVPKGEPEEITPREAAAMKRQIDAGNTQPSKRYREWLKNHPESEEESGPKSISAPQVELPKAPKAEEKPAEEVTPKTPEAAAVSPKPEYHPTGTIRHRTDGNWALHVGMNHEAHTPFVRLFRTDKAAEFARDDLQKKYGASLMDHVTADRLANPEVKPPAAAPPEVPKSSPKPTAPEATHGGGGSFEEAPEYPGPGTEITSKGVTEHGKRKVKPVMGAPSTPLPQAPAAPIAPPTAPAGGPPAPQVAPASAAPVPAPAAPVEPAASESQEKEAPQEETPQTQEPIKKPRKPKQEGATPESAPLQKHLREKEGMSPGKAHETVHGGQGTLLESTGGDRGAKGLGAGKPVGADLGGRTGAYGYVGDASPDTGSLHGVGAYPHVQKWGSLIEGYSAGLTEEAGRKRGLVHGQEFLVNNHLFRWDDTANKYFTLNGKQHVIPDDYVDVYSPHHTPDKGVSQAEIERQTKIAQERPGYDGIGTVEGENEGGKGGMTGGSNPMQGPAKPATAQASTPPAPAPVYNLPEGAQPVTARSIGAAEEAAIAAATNRTGAASNPGTEEYNQGIQQHMFQSLGQQHFQSLTPEDTRIRLDPESGMIAGTHFVPDDIFHQWLLKNQSPQSMSVINQVQDAIAGKKDLFLNYGSAVHGEPGTPTGSQREQSQATSPAQAREKGLTDIQEAGKHIIPTYMSVAPRASEPNTVTVGGLCYSSDTEILTRRGWMRFFDLLPTDQVATRNPVTKEFEWQIPTAHINSPYLGKMIHFGSISVDVLVTPEHRMLWVRRKGVNKASQERVSSASDLASLYNGNGQIAIPMTSKWIGNDVGDQTFRNYPVILRNNTSGYNGVSWCDRTKTWHAEIWVHGKKIYLGSSKSQDVAGKLRSSADKEYATEIETSGRNGSKPITISGDDFCALMGAYIAEGSVVSSKTRKGIRISQGPESKAFKTYKELFERIQGRSGYSNGKHGGAFSLYGKSLSEYFKQFGRSEDKFIPECVMDASVYQIRLFLHYYMLGDGCFQGISIDNVSGKVTKDGASIRFISSTTSKRLADQLQELWQKSGFSASVRKQNPGIVTCTYTGKVYKCLPQYIVSVRRTLWMTFTAKEVDYHGTVHCVTVPNGTVYVRRNGKPAWSYNSPDKIIENASHISHELGPKSPYPPMLDNGVAKEDLRGYAANSAAGWKGDGSGPVTPLPGHEEDVPQTPSDFTPYPLGKKKASFWNLSINGPDAKMSQNAKAAPKAAKAFELSKLNEGYAKQGYTNPLAHSIDMAHGPMPVMVKDQANPEGPKIPKLDKSGKPVTQLWTQGTLHSGYERINVPLIKTIHTGGEEGAPPIHVSNEAATKALQEKGLPPSQTVKAGFMPGETTGFVSPEYGSGKEDKAPQGRVLKEPGPVVTTEDRLKKNEQLRSQLDKQQAKLDTTTPEGDKQWNDLATKIHELESDHEILKQTPELHHEDVNYAKGQFLPGDDRERIKSAAILHNGVRYEGFSHAMAYANAEDQLGEMPKRGSAKEGFTTTPTEKHPEGRFVDRKEAWNIARANNQLKEGARELTPLSRVQKTPMGGKIEGLASENVNVPHGTKAGFMPGDLLEHPETGERETVAGKYVKFPSGNVYTHPNMHALAQAEGFANGEPEDAPVEGGYISSTGRLMSDEEGWALAKANKQLKAGAKKISDMTEAEKAQRKVTGSGRSGLESSDLLPAKSQFMPGDLDPARRERILDEAVENHGLTTNPAESGYLLPNGKFLDMSGGKLGQRTIEHDGIDIHTDRGENPVDLMRKSGAVRINDWGDSGGQTEMGHLPLTKAQRDVLMDHFKDGEGLVSVVDNNRRALHEKEYPAGTSNTQIMGDAIRGQMGANMGAAKAHFMPGAEEDKKALGPRSMLPNAARLKAGPSDGWDAGSGKAQFMPAEKKIPKSPEQIAAEKEDLAQAQIDRSNITTAQKRDLNRVRNIAKQWIKDNPDLPETSAHQYLQDKKSLPKGIKTKEGLAKYFDDVNPKLDYSKLSDREIAATALTHDAMHELARGSNAYGWHDRTVDKSIKKISEVAPDILTNKTDELAFKLATAITSQGQDVFPNFESGYLAYRHWKTTGEMPTDATIFGGGAKNVAMIQNFEKINDLWDKHGPEELQRILETPMTMRELEEKYGIDIGNESPNHTMEGAAMLGPKIGSFFNNLNKRFHTITFDMWASRTLNRLSGSMLKFSPDALLKDRKSASNPDATPEQRQKALSQLSQMEQLLDSGAIKGDQAKTLRKEAKALRKLGPTPTREQVLQTAPEMAEWAKQLHSAYAKGDGYNRSFPKEMKSPSTLLAKNLDTNLTELSDLPGGPKERQQWREIFGLVQRKMKDAGISMNHANNQALFWYLEKQLFKKAGASSRGGYDYLDASHRLVRKIQQGELPSLPSSRESISPELSAVP